MRRLTWVIIGIAVVAVVTLGLIDAYRGIANTAENLMNGIDIESPLKNLKDIEGLEGLDLENLDVEALQKQLPGLNFDVDIPELRDIERR